MPDVFLSHSTKNQRFAIAMRTDLTRMGLEVFMAPYSISPGAKWADSILESLRVSPWVVVLVTKESIESKFVQQEIGGAIIGKKGIIPVLLDSPPEKLPGWLSRYQAVDVRGLQPMEIQMRVLEIAKHILAYKAKIRSEENRKALLIIGGIATAMALASDDGE